MSIGSKRQRAAAAIVLGIVTAGLGLLAWAFLELQGRYGPSYGAVLSDGRVVLASHGYLHVFRDGKRVERIRFKDMGLGTLVVDLDALADGALLIGDADSKSLMSCRLGERRCSVFYDGAANADGKPRNAFKAAVEPGSGRVVLSDSSNHRLLLLDARGRLLHATEIGGPSFTFPNGLAYIADGTLAVADTDHARIAFLNVGRADFGATGELRTRQVFPGTSFLQPIEVVPDVRGRLWTILASNALQTGSVVSMQADGSLPLLAPLPGEADPLSLVALGDAMLALEPTTYRVTRFALADGSAEPFGGRAFQDELHAEVAWRSRVLFVRQAAQALLVLALVAALAVAVRSRTMRISPQLRPRWNLPAEAEPLAHGVSWVEADPLPGRGMVIGYGAVSLLLFGGYYFWLRGVIKASEPIWLQLQLLFVMLLLIAAYAAIAARRLSRGRLGTDGQSLFVEDAGRSFQAPLADCLYSNRRLLAGWRVVVLRVPAGDRYPSDRVAAAILARLPPEAKVGEWRLSRTCMARVWGRFMAKWRR